MTPESTVNRDVHAHAQDADLAGKRPWGRRKDRKSAPAPATQARVIQFQPRQSQEATPEETSDDSGRSRKRSKTSQSSELAAGLNLLTETARESDLAEQPMTVIESWEQIFPERGEAPGKLAWIAMSIAGFARAVIVTFGHLIVRGADTRIKAGIQALILLIALALAYAAGHLH